jgi:cyclohexanone monooxygenase
MDERDSPLDAIVIGAGFGGIQVLHELRKRGMSACGIEAGTDVGGAWYWNRYPGARCDVESFAYAFTFPSDLDTTWKWTERFPRQPEIQRYLRTAAELFGVYDLIRFSTRVTAGRYEEAENLWIVTLDSGEELRARYFIAATGPLTKAVWPDVPGIDDFAGERYHTARWPESASIAGKRIGVIGNGSSGTQFITAAAQEASELHVFIRTPQYSIPARNSPLTEQDHTRWQTRRTTYRADLEKGIVRGAGDLFADPQIIANRKPAAAFTPQEQRQALEAHWALGGAQLLMTFTDITTNDDANKLAADFVREKIRETIKDPAKVEKLMPTYLFAGKRIVIDTGFFESLNQGHVFIHDIRNHSFQVTATGAEVPEGPIELDMLVCATGFDAVTGALDQIDIRGRNGVTLAEHWREGAKAYMGIAVPDFPNMFMINGPGAPAAFSNVAVINHWCVDFVFKLIDRMQWEGQSIVEATPAAETYWMNLIDEISAPTIFVRTESWYNGSNIAGKKRGITSFFNSRRFREEMIAAEQRGFDHFAFS